MNRPGAAALVAATACWGSLSATTTVALRGFAPMTLLVGELAVGVLVLVTACLVTGERLPSLSWRIIALGLLEPGVTFVAFDFGVQRTSAAHAGVLTGTETVFVVVLGMVFLRERPGLLALTGILLAVAGVSVLTMSESGKATLLGDGLVLLDTITGAIAAILTVRLVRDDVRPLALTTAQFAVGLVLVLPLGVLTQFSGSGRLAAGALRLGPIIALLLTGALLASAFLIYAWALTRVSATAAGAALTLIPLFALVVSTLILQEPLTLNAAVSTALILAGLVVYTRFASVQAPSAPSDWPESEYSTTV